jgi:hypothetical protein
VTTHNAWGEDRVFLQEKDRLRALPIAWTDAAPADPFVVVAAGRAFWRTEDLIKLIELFQGRQREGETHAVVNGTVKETSPHV